MRLKRSEYNTMQDVIANNTNRILGQAIRISEIENKIETSELRYDLEEYGLCLNRNVKIDYYSSYTRYEVCDYDGNIQYSSAELSGIKKRFEGYKDGIENGDIFVECNCEEISPKKSTLDNLKTLNKNAKKVLNSKKK